MGATFVIERVAHHRRTDEKGGGDDDRKNKVCECG